MVDGARHAGKRIAARRILSGDISTKYGDLPSGADNPHWAAAVQNQSDHLDALVTSKCRTADRFTTSGAATLTSDAGSKGNRCAVAACK